MSDASKIAAARLRRALGVEPAEIEMQGTLRRRMQALIASKRIQTQQSSEATDTSIDRASCGSMRSSMQRVVARNGATR